MKPSDSRVLAWWQWVAGTSLNAEPVLHNTNDLVHAAKCNSSHCAACCSDLTLAQVVFDLPVACALTVDLWRSGVDSRHASGILRDVS